MTTPTQTSTERDNAVTALTPEERAIVDLMSKLQLDDAATGLDVHTLLKIIKRLTAASPERETAVSREKLAQVIEQAMHEVEWSAGKRPSLDELEDILNSQESPRISILPDGSITAGPPRDAAYKAADTIRAFLIPEGETTNAERLASAMREIETMTSGLGDILLKARPDLRTPPAQLPGNSTPGGPDLSAPCNNGECCDAGRCLYPVEHGQAAQLPEEIAEIEKRHDGDDRCMKEHGVRAFGKIDWMDIHRDRGALLRALARIGLAKKDLA